MMNKSTLAVFLVAALLCATGTKLPAQTLSPLQQDASLAAFWDFESAATVREANGWSVRLSSGTPRIVPGVNGQGALIEEKSRNFLPPFAASCTDVQAFEAVGGAMLSIEKAGELSTLLVRGDGSKARQGVRTKAVESTLSPSGYAVGSFSISGSGRVCVQLLDESNYTIGAPLYINLKPELTRVSPPPIECRTPGARLQLSIVSAEKSPVSFQMASLQIEPLPCATSWMPGGEERAANVLEYTLSHRSANLKSGTLLMWVRPNWNNRMNPEVLSAAGKEQRTFFSFRAGNAGLILQWSVYGTLSTGKTRLARTELADGNWHLLAMTWQGTAATIYADGKTANTQIAPISPQAKLVFGPSANAVIDDAALLTTPLSKAMLDKLFEARPKQDVTAPSAEPAESTPAEPIEPRLD